MSMNALPMLQFACDRPPHPPPPPPPQRQPARSSTSGSPHKTSEYTTRVSINLPIRTDPPPSAKLAGKGCSFRGVWDPPWG